MVFLTYEKGVGDHPENKDVTLRVMDLKTRQGRSAGAAVRWPGHDQCFVMGAEQPVPGVRELPDRAPVML